MAELFPTTPCGGRSDTPSAAPAPCTCQLPTVFREDEALWENGRRRRQDAPWLILSINKPATLFFLFHDNDNLQSRLHWLIFKRIKELQGCITKLARQVCQCCPWNSTDLFCASVTAKTITSFTSLHLVVKSHFTSPLPRELDSLVLVNVVPCWRPGSFSWGASERSSLPLSPEPLNSQCHTTADARRLCDPTADAAKRPAGVLHSSSSQRWI